MKKLTKKKGFTLVELLVVVAIIAILMLIALPRLTDATKGAKIRTFEANARALMSSANISVANNNGKADNIGTDLTEQLKEVHDPNANHPKSKPAGATYEVKDDKLNSADPANTKLLVCTFGTYIIKYDAATGKVVQENKPSGATDLTAAQN